MVGLRGTDAPVAESSKDFVSDKYQSFIKFDKSIKLPKDREKAIKKHLGVPNEELIYISKFLPTHYRLQIWRTIQKFMTINLVVLYEKNQKNNVYEQIPADFIQVDSSYNKTELALLRGIVFGRYKEKNILLEIYPTERAMVVKMYTKNDTDYCNDFLTMLVEESKKNSPYIGQKLYYDGCLHFLRPSKITFKDIILDEEVCRVINEQFLYPINNQKNMKESKLPLKRGLLIDGKPGTGKTIFGKALMNECKEATMIFVTSKSLNYTEILILYLIVLETFIVMVTHLP